ncbi:response regulator [Lysinibacillus capsici]|uniref:response regulator n=1 Tax=Lysinibacillus capsici TaxID=2115968 RepID=UPI002E1DF00B|nr:response regulator [Lysinibacillus capsici]
MNILLIEDTLTKIKAVKSFLLNSNITIENIECRHSWQSGLLELINNSEKYDFLILDMSMPRYDADIADSNEEFETYAGWEILKEINRLNLSIPSCIFTSYDYFGEGSEAINREEINESLKQEFPNIYKGLIYFRNSESTWKDKLMKVLTEVQS